MGKSERADTGERQRVDQDLQRLLDQLADRTDAGCEAPMMCRVPAAEEQRGGRRHRQAGRRDKGREQAEVDDDQRRVGQQPQPHLAAPPGRERIQPQPHGQQHGTTHQRRQQHRERRV